MHGLAISIIDSVEVTRRLTFKIDKRIRVHEKEHWIKTLLHSHLIAPHEVSALYFVIDNTAREIRCIVGFAVIFDCVDRKKRCQR